jgi:cobalt-zinc-cadmium efflux system outer membrane protein
MRARVAFSGVLLALTPAQPAALIAQVRADSVLTEAGSVELARTRHPLLVAASGHRAAASARARQEAASPNPTFEWRAENIGSPLTHDQFATISVPLDVTGRRFALRGAAGAVADRALADSVTVARRIEADAARAYWGAALARELLTSASERRQTAERLAVFDMNRSQLGAVAEVAAMRTRLESDRARIAEAVANTEWRRTIADLALATGVPAMQLPPPASIPDPSAEVVAVPDVAALVSVALARRSELVALRAAVAEARQRVTAESRGALGDVVVQAGTKQTAGYNTRVIGVGVPLPIFNRNDAGRARARAELTAVEAELRAAEDAVTAQVTAAVESYAALAMVSPASGEAIATQGDEIARVVDAAYREGGTSLIEVLEAQRARAESSVAALRWMAELRLARIEIAWATNAPITERLEQP